ncbi:hypothetical protein [Roseateles sp.]|uniref:hypothetical protein n=1 Tax=Roseateles sp. TaxID=1971397 RepID=UPI003956CD5B
MTPLDALWHVTNLLAPAWGVSVLLALLLRVVWRAQRMDLRKMVLWGGLGGMAAIGLALLLLGRDGKMAGYALLITGVSLPQWWLTRR